MQKRERERDRDKKRWMVKSGVGQQWPCQLTGHLFPPLNTYVLNFKLKSSSRSLPYSTFFLSLTTSHPLFGNWTLYSVERSLLAFSFEIYIYSAAHKLRSHHSHSLRSFFMCARGASTIILLLLFLANTQPMTHRLTLTITSVREDLLFTVGPGPNTDRTWTHILTNSLVRKSTLPFFIQTSILALLVSTSFLFYEHLFKCKLSLIPKKTAHCV